MNRHLNQPYVYEQHRIPLEQAATYHAKGDFVTVGKLYLTAVLLAANGNQAKTAGVYQERLVVQKSKKGEEVRATVTDEASGLTLTLTGLVSQQKNGFEHAPLLSFGRRYLMETQHPQLSNTAVKLWRG